MSASIRFLVLLLLVAAFSGCSTCPKESEHIDCSSSYVPSAAETVVTAPQAVKAPVAEPVADEIPAKVMKYVSK